MALALTCALFGSGCYFARSPIRPVPALFAARDAHTRARCLVVFVPGLMDGPGSFVEHGLMGDLLASEHARCDAVAVDLTYRYYFGARPDEPLYEDVLVPALARGYDEVWLVGISLGGLGAVLLARAHPELIDGLVLLSPFLGLEEIAAQIDAEGGLAAWQPPSDLPARIDDATFGLHVWTWLRGHASDPDRMPQTFVGWSAGERLEPTARTLAAVLPADHAVRIEGRHDWHAWRALFREILPRARMGER